MENKNEHELHCPICFSDMLLDKKIHTKAKFRIRRYKCSNLSCDYSEVIKMGGYTVKLNEERIKNVNEYEKNFRRSKEGYY